MYQTPYLGKGEKLKSDATEQICILNVRVKPNSSINVISMETDGSVTVRLTSAPVEGKANRDLIKLIAKKLRIPQSDISIERGERGKNKTLILRGISREIAKKKLLD